MPQPGIDESYSLSTSVDQTTGGIQVKLDASTIFGARHGLETLSQLVVYDDLQQKLAVAGNVQILDDKPAFPYRGVMIDVSRNFISVDKLKENIKAIGYNKMNVLHMHLSDTASFPMTIPSEPNVTIYGAYNDEKIFSKEDILDLVNFAATYGVMILPEIDGPAHMSAGWQWGEAAGLGELLLCADPYGQNGHQWDSDALEPPSGQLNLANPNAFKVLDKIYGDVIEQIPSPIFHIGGDEVIVGSDEAWAACYNSTKLAKPLLEYIDQLGLSRQDQSTFYALWENFTIAATNLVQSHYQSKAIPYDKLHIWGGGGVDSSGVSYNLLSQPNLSSFLPSNLFRIQIWDESDGSITPSLLEQGYEVILSNTDYVYLDCGNSGPTQAGGYWCQPYHEWYHIYQYIQDVTSLWQLSDASRKKIFGSETLIWTEMVDDINVSQKLWPRSAALAEALWTDPKHGWYEAAPRMQQWRNKLVARGINAEALQPFWCQQRSGDVCNINAGTPQ